MSANFDLPPSAIPPKMRESEVFDPNDSVDEDDQTRASLVWESSPMQLLQPRISVRLYDGIPASDLQNRDEFFAELHVFF